MSIRGTSCILVTSSTESIVYVYFVTGLLALDDTMEDTYTVEHPELAALSNVSVSQSTKHRLFLLQYTVVSLLIKVDKFTDLLRLPEKNPCA